MATNKNAQIRYKILDNCFRNSGRRYFIEDLIRECNRKFSEIDPNSKGISRRQIFDDISFMESSEGWEIDLLKLKDGKRVFYRYADTKFSINNMPLNESDINRLQTALQTISQFKGMPQFEWMCELIPKLKQGITDMYSPVIMEFENNQDLKGIEHIGTLYDAIVYKKVLAINYLQSFKEKVLLTIHPYYLKQFNNRWFLFGYNPDKEKYDWNLPLDRITSIAQIQKEYIPNSAIDWSEYFDDIIGVTKPENAVSEKITLHFYDKTAHYIESKPIHGYQKHRWLDDTTLEVHLELIINYELERLILSYADSTKVIQPQSLADRIKLRLNKAKTIHFDLLEAEAGHEQAS
ncbi:MAG: WYL domain-containing protein [Prevotellaceae bacterium]|jgi:predicted DNA-binding transcriptional regulator YafY|nr:WYL domain-containing protein [Prevotellaceae bacterium]